MEDGVDRPVAPLSGDWHMSLFPVSLGLRGSYPIYQLALLRGAPSRLPDALWSRLALHTNRPLFPKPFAAMLSIYGPPPSEDQS